MINFKNSDFWKLLRPISSWKQFVSQIYWHGIYSFLWAFNGLEDRCESPEPWPLQRLAVQQHICKKLQKNRKIRSNNSLQLQPVTSTLQYKNIKISSYCSLVGLSVWRFFPSFSFILEYYSFLMLQGTINQRSGTTQMLLSLET